MGIKNSKLEEIRSRMPQEIKDRVDRTVRERDEMISLLEAFARFLEEGGYIDSDWRTEEPFAIDKFLREYERDKV